MLDDVTLTCKHCTLEIMSSEDRVIEITATEFEWICPNPECDENNYVHLEMEVD